jgi:spermidine/putrescine transport system permease protein
MFLNVGVATGFGTIVIAHIMFNVSFVVVTVRSRLIGFDRSMEEAAQDLGANGLQTFFRITLPLIAPGILAGALLAFALSIDDYVITSFVSGRTTTFPLWVFGVSRIGVPPEVNVLGTLIFGVAFVFIGLQIWLQRRQRRADAVLNP